MVCDYTRLNFLQIQDLYCDEFRLILRDAFIYKMQQSKEGREFLEECKRFETTIPDRQKLRERFSEKGGARND